MGMSQIHIDEVHAKGKTYPMIVEFQNGYINEDFKQQECSVVDNKETGKKVVSLDLGELLYTGEESREDIGKTLILARNKKTGKVRLIEVGSVSLKPVIKTDTDSAEVLESSHLELSRKFGSKKNKQIMEQKEKLKVNVDTVKEQMHNVTMNVTEEQLDVSLYNKSNTDEIYIPEINHEATKVDEVYDMNKILTPEQYEKIYTEIEGTEYKSNLNPFLKNIITNNLTSKQCVLAVYADSLLYLYSTLMKDISKKNFVACPFSVTLNQIVLANFLKNINGKRSRPPQYRDKALCHALVFALMINNFKFDLEDLCQHLKLTPRSIATKASITGATIVTVNNKKVAQLKLPLSKPLSRRKSAKF